MDAITGTWKKKNTRMLVARSLIKTGECNCRYPSSTHNAVTRHLSRPGTSSSSPVGLSFFCPKATSVLKVFLIAAQSLGKCYFPKPLNESRYFKSLRSRWRRESVTIDVCVQAVCVDIGDQTKLILALGQTPQPLHFRESLEYVQSHALSWGI